MLARRLPSFAALILLAAGCSAGESDNPPPRDVPRDVADADASRCGPTGECEDLFLDCCPDGCVDLRNDFLNCGACDYECALDEECRAGVCIRPECFPECDPRQICCRGDCVNPSSDNGNCGDCGNTCDAPLRCLGGVCMCDPGVGGTARLCSPTEDCCPTGCVDLMTDGNNCGACGASCGGLPCNAWQCSCGTSVCPPGQTCCDPADGLCADLAGDMDHCGHCDTRCDPDRSTACVDGDCMCGGEEQCASGTVTYPLCHMAVVTPPHRCCSGACTRIDDWSCGRCGQRCSAGTECTASASVWGYCSFSCQVPE